MTESNWDMTVVWKSKIKRKKLTNDLYRGIIFLQVIWLKLNSKGEIILINFECFRINCESLTIIEIKLNDHAAGPHIYYLFCSWGIIGILQYYSRMVMQEAARKGTDFLRKHNIIETEKKLLYSPFGWSCSCTLASLCLHM